MKDRERTDAFIHYIMSLTGGFMGAYGLFNRFEIFGSAQTSNLIHSVTDLAGGNWSSLLLRMGALFIFMTAIAATVFISGHSRHNLRLICILLEIPVVMTLGFLPADMNPMIALYPVFFIMAFQWCAFTGVKGYASSTIFSTNNLRQFVTALCMYRDSRDRKHLEKAAVYGYTLLFYHIGVAVSCFATRAFGTPCVWLCILPLGLSLVLMERERLHITAAYKGRAHLHLCK